MVVCACLVTRVDFYSALLLEQLQNNVSSVALLKVCMLSLLSSSPKPGLRSVGNVRIDVTDY
jgi:hypothetical protein